MINQGMVFLFDKKGILVDGKKYQSPGKRKLIIENWRKMYAAAYHNCFIQIVPNVNENLVNNLNGKNIKPLEGWYNPNTKKKIPVMRAEGYNK